MEIRNLENIDFDTLYQGFAHAFADYEISFDRHELQSMLTRRGFNSELSLAAFSGGSIAAFSFIGTGTHNSVPSAYDIATGTAAPFRGQSLAREIFTRSLPLLKDAGTKQYVLEVLQSNSNAISLYKSLGFKESRQLLCFRQSIDAINCGNGSPRCTIAPIEPEQVMSAASFCNFTPSWQNSTESIMRGSAGLTCLGAFCGDTIAGLCVFDPLTGDIARLAVHQSHRRSGIASALLRRALPMFKTGSVKVLNISSDDTTLPAFLKSMNILPAASQFEMILPL